MHIELCGAQSEPGVRARPPAAPMNEAREAAFTAIVKTGDERSLARFLDRLFEELQENCAPPAGYQACAIELLALLLKAARGTACDAQAHVSGQLETLACLCRQGDAEQSKAQLQAVCLQIMSELDQPKDEGTVEDLAKLALTYLGTQYADSDLTLKAMSAALHVSPNYLSAVIKRATGSSFTRLLTRARMEKARELLLFTRLNLQEIAEACGYVDRHYFSYCFKKYYGCAPAYARGSGADGFM